MLQALSPEEKALKGGIVSEDANSIYQKAPVKMQPFLAEIPDYMLQKTEQSMRNDANASRDDSLALLRVNFWAAFNQAVDNSVRMSTVEILKGACSESYLYGAICTAPAKLAYMITPPKSLRNMQELILRRTLHSLRSSLDLEPFDTTTTVRYDKEGNVSSEVVVRKINSSLLRERRELAMMLTDRVQGSVVQKLALKSQTFGGGGPVGHKVSRLSPEEEMKAIEGELLEPTEGELLKEKDKDKDTEKDEPTAKS